MSGSRIAVACLFAVSLLAPALDAQAQPAPDPKKAAAPARAAPAARPAPASRPAPPPRMAAPARPSAPPRMAAPSRPSAPPRMQARPAQRSAPSIQRASPSRAAPSRIAQPRREMRQENRRAAQRRAPNRRNAAAPAQNRNATRNANPVTNRAATRTAAPVNRAAVQRDQRQERIARQREDRQLRSLPPRQRAARREQIQQQRQQRAQRRDQQTNPAARQGIAATQDAQSRRAGQNRTANRTVTPQAALQGRFGTAFRARGGRDPGARAERLAGRQAWRQGRRASFVAWTGPVFWPYAYSDIFDYTFFPAAYEEGFWAYAYDDFFDSVFWPDGGPYAGYASAGPYGGDVTAALPGRQRSSSSQAQQRVAKQLCSDPAKGITAWPFERITEVVRPTAEQRGLLDELKRAAASAAETFKRSCADEVSLTPPGRLQVMLDRLQSTRDALGMVRPPLEKFYGSLTDEQRARFNAIGPAVGRDAKAAPDDAQNLTASCGQPKPGLTNLPIDRIGEVVNPAGAQKDALDALSADTKKALDVLAGACPDEIPQTPVGRMEAMEKRLDAMISAAKTVQPSLGTFYTSLSAEQKARFNSMAGDEERGAN